MELIVAPRAYGGTVYYSYIIVPVNKSGDGFQRLRGKPFAFTDPSSNTGKRVPTHLLLQMNETPESFFSEYIFTYVHDGSIRRVALGKVSGAAVNHLIWEYQNKANPVFTKKTRIIWKSESFGIPPVVTSPSCDSGIKNRVRQSFDILAVLQE